MQSKDDLASNKDFLKAILKQVSPALFFAFGFFLVAGQALYLFLPRILELLVDQFTVERSQISTYLLLSFPLVWLLSLVLSSAGRYYCNIITQRIRNISKEIVFKYLVSLPSNVYFTKDSGEVENLMQELSFGARYIFNENISSFLRTAVTLLMATIFIAMISMELCLLFLIWVVIYIPIAYISAKRSVSGVSSSILSSSQVSVATVEVVQNHELIPAFGTEAFEILRYRSLLDKEESAFNKAQKRIDLCDLLQRSLQILLPFALVLVLIYFEKPYELTPGIVAGLLSLTIILAGQTGDLGKGILSFLEMQERMKTALSKLKISVPPVRHERKRAQPTYWNIHFDNVNFSYENRLTLEGIQLEIAENEKVGIVGYSGAGKTTLTKLLRGYLIPNKGNIKIGGCSVHDIHPRYMAQNISEVSQSIPLFHRTLRENICYGLEGISDQAIWETLDKACMIDYVNTLPDKLDTVIGVKGQKFSGGERARIAIARAFIRNSKIVIMDEALAAVDSESERLIQESLHELVKGRTVITIAHRFSSLRSVDKIILLDKGKIIAQGSHEMLIQNNPIYKGLWSSQTVL